MQDFKKQITDFISKNKKVTFADCKIGIVGAGLHYKDQVSSDYNLSFYNLLRDGVIV